MVRLQSHSKTISHIFDLNGSRFSNHADIENAFISFYTNLWTDSLDNDLFEIALALPINLPSISEVEGNFLVRDVTREEIYFTLFNLPTGKSPGPDGITYEFFHFFWNDIGDQVTDIVLYFFNNVVMPASWGKTFVTLIPKKDNPNLVSDYRPISLCNVIYKIVSKILANRLSSILPNLIGWEQSGFVAGRCPFDNIIALQEIVHSLERDTINLPRMIINIDIEKAYDTIRWSAILATLTRMNFPDHWISWIHTYLNSASFSFFIDGQQTRWIYSSRGVRQGDPISSYLFVLVSQSLTNMLNLALSFGHIPGFNINFNIRFNHLMYADDLVIISRASRATAHNIIGCLEIYGFLTS